MTLEQFTFRKRGSGAYSVTYTTPRRRDYYTAVIEDMTLIDATLLADEYPTQKALRELRQAVTRGSGRNKRHYSRDGKLLD